MKVRVAKFCLTEAGFTPIRVGLVLGAICLVLAPAAVNADPQEDQNACMQDAMTTCGQFIPDRERVAACLIAHRAIVSAACREALKHFTPQTASAH